MDGTNRQNKAARCLKLVPASGLLQLHYENRLGLVSAFIQFHCGSDQTRADLLFLVHYSLDLLGPGRVLGLTLVAARFQLIRCISVILQVPLLTHGFV